MDRGADRSPFDPPCECVEDLALVALKQGLFLAVPVRRGDLKDRAQAIRSALPHTLIAMFLRALGTPNTPLDDRHRVARPAVGPAFQGPDRRGVLFFQSRPPSEFPDDHCETQRAPF